MRLLKTVSILALTLLYLCPWLQAQDDISDDLETVRDTYHLPGMMALVLKDGKIIAQGTAGVRRLGSPDPLQLSDPINIGSNTKWMTAVLAGHLVDEGLIRWDTRIRDVFPEYESFSSVFHNATLEQILAHRAGIQSGATFESRYWTTVQQQSGSIQEIRRWVVDTVLSDDNEVAPGEYLYSNQGYTVAATMLELVSGKSWEALMQEYLFKPSRMGSATVGSSYESASDSGVVVGHYLTQGSDTATPVAPLGGNSALLPYQASTGPGGHTLTSLYDWAKWLHLQVTADLGGYLKPDTVNKLQSGYQGVEDYGLGVFSVARNWATPGPALSHSGLVFYQHSVFWLSPGRDLVIVVYSNCRSADNSVASALDTIAGQLVSAYSSGTAEGPFIESPGILSADRTGETLMLEYSSLPGLDYQLENSDNLSNWTPIGDASSSSQLQSSKTTAMPDQRTFLRIRAIP